MDKNQSNQEHLPSVEYLIAEMAKRLNIDPSNSKETIVLQAYRSILSGLGHVKRYQQHIAKDLSAVRHLNKILAQKDHELSPSTFVRAGNHNNLYRNFFKSYRSIHNNDESNKNHDVDLICQRPRNDSALFSLAVIASALEISDTNF